MKLFIWRDVLTDWTSGNVTALAKDLATARRALKKTLGKDSEGWRELKDMAPTETHDTTKRRTPVVVITYGGS